MGGTTSTIEIAILALYRTRMRNLVLIFLIRQSSAIRVTISLTTCLLYYSLEQCGHISIINIFTFLVVRDSHLCEAGSFGQQFIVRCVHALPRQIGAKSNFLFWCLIYHKLIHNFQKFLNLFLATLLQHPLETWQNRDRAQPQTQSS